MSIFQQYLMYLRKSQMDRDFENVSVEETLRRHRKTLEEFCRPRGINVTVVLEEVVSGESLASRPKMLELLELVNTGEYAGVVCMDIDRLSRGSAVDSGYITQVFQINDCKIVTPAKTYDLLNESDEQFTDMKFMFSRYELKTITRRLQDGRVASVKEGKYIGSIRPYGYEVTKLKGIKGNTLTVNPDEAKIVQMIYDMYVNKRIGFNGIANELNDLGIPSKSTVPQWTRAGIMTIIRNPLYTGKLRHHWTKGVKTIEDGKVVKKRKWTPNDYEVYDGLHEPIISQELWNQAQEVREKKLVNHVKKQCNVRNQFAGLLKCGICGKPYHMANSTHKGGQMKYQCRTHGCPNRSVICTEVDSAILREMRMWFHQYTIDIDTDDHHHDTTIADALLIVNKKLAELEAQQDTICELFENGEYSATLFKKRNSAIEEKIKELNSSKVELERKIAEEENANSHKQIIIPTTQKLLDNYDQMTTEERNRLWKEVLEKVTVERLELKGDFTVRIYPKI